MVVAGVTTAVVGDFWDMLVDGHQLLGFIADGHEVYWHLLQGLVLMTSILLVVTFIAASIALLQVDRVLAALGGILLVVSQILFMAYYPVLLGIAYLAGEYEGATPGRQDDLAVSAEALIAQNSGFNPAYEVMMGAGAMLLGLAMLKGVFSRWSAYLGIGSFIAVIGTFAIINVFFWLLDGPARTRSRLRGSEARDQPGTRAGLGPGCAGRRGVGIATASWAVP